MPVFPPVFLQAEAAVAPVPAWSTGMALARANPAPGAGSSSVPQPHVDTWVSDPIQQCQDCLSQNIWGWDSASMAQRTAVNECWRGLFKALSQSP